MATGKREERRSLISTVHAAGSATVEPRPAIRRNRQWTALEKARRSWPWVAVVEMSSADSAGLAAELAYRVFLAVIPSVLFVTAVVGLVAQIEGGSAIRISVQRELARNLPPEATSFLLPFLTGPLQSRAPNVVSVGVILSLWTLSSVITTVMKAMSRMLQIRERRSYLKQRVEALILAVFLPALLLISFILAWFGRLVRQLVVEVGPNLAAPFFLSTFRVTAAWALAVFTIWLLLEVAAPVQLPRHRLLFGALTTVAGVWLASEVFAFYAGHFVRYGSTYGLLGGALALATWLYVCSFCLLFGLELVALLQERRPVKAGSGLPDPRVNGNHNPAKP